MWVGEGVCSDDRERERKRMRENEIVGDEIGWEAGRGAGKEELR